MTTVVKRLAAALAVAAAGGLALAALGLFVPIPAVDVVAAVSTTVWFWVLVLALVVALVFGWGWRRRRGAWRAAGAALSSLAVVGYGIAGGQQVALAQEVGAPVDVLSVALGHDVVDARTSYTDKDGTTLPMAVYRPKTMAGAPVILWIHGGGWTSGDHDVTAHSRWLADQGYLVVSAEYTLSDESTHEWDRNTDQLLCALGAAARYAQRQGADASRVATMGDSAGGQLAMMVGYRAHEGNPCGGSLPAVKAVATIYPVASPADFERNSDPVTGHTSDRMARAYTGGTPEDVPQRYDAVDPSRVVDGDTPPTAIVYGTNDHLVPPQGSLDLAATLRAKGVDTTLIGVPHAEHVMDLNVDDIASSVFRTVSLDFLRAHGMAVHA